MTESKHTPGPWQFGHLRAKTLWVGPDYRQRPVAHVGHDTEYARDNSRANARLIAAAPELLEALKVTARGIEGEFGPRVAEVNFPSLYSAIAKAEGRG